MSRSKIAIIALSVLAAMASGHKHIYPAEERMVWGRDPFVLEEAAEEGMSNVGGLKLMGITAAKNGKSKAVINDRIVSKGSTIGKFKVVDIWPDRVIVLDREEKTEIELKL